MSKLVFKSILGPWSVWTCACGCGDSVLVWDDQWPQMPGGNRVYARHHQPLGCDPVRVCSPYNGEYAQNYDFTPSTFDDEETPVSLNLLENDDERAPDPQPDYPFGLLDDPDYDTGI